MVDKERNDSGLIQCMVYNKDSRLIKLHSCCNLEPCGKDIHGSRYLRMKIKEKSIKAFAMTIVVENAKHDEYSTLHYQYFSFFLTVEETNESFYGYLFHSSLYTICFVESQILRKPPPTVLTEVTD